jgi:hypothetical protein
MMGSHGSWLSYLCQPDDFILYFEVSIKLSTNIVYQLSTNVIQI